MRELTALLLVVLCLSGCSSALPPRPVDNTLSLDGGPVSLSVTDAVVNGGATVASSGTRVAVAWSGVSEKAGAKATNIYAAVSEDGGATFGVPVRVNDIDGDARVTGEQPPRIAVGQDIVVVWESRADGVARVRMARSTDNGRTFLPAGTVHAEELGGAKGWSSVALDGEGGAHVLWLDGRNAQAGKKSGGIPAAGAGHAMHGSSRQDIFQAVFRPSGEMAEAPIATNVCFCCKTSVAVAKDGAVYAAWRHIYPTNLRDMAVARSTDGGASFNEPVRVSEDHWEIDGCPEDGPAIAVDSESRLHIAWPAMLEGSDSRKGIFYSASTDRGQSFVQRVRLDERRDDKGIDAAASHPQIAVLDSSVFVVWEERTGAGHWVIRGRSLPADRTSSSFSEPLITVADSVADAYPAVASVPGGAIAVWRESGSFPAIRVQRLK